MPEEVPDEIDLRGIPVDDDGELDIVGLLDSAYDEDTKTVRDLKIDDRDFSRAKNMFDFCTNYLGKGSKMPFARQMWVGYQLLSEYCPRCSDPKWKDIRNVPVDFRPADMPDHVMFLENGVCPKCKATKSQLYKNELLNNYQELNLLAGQRSGKCLIGSTLVVTDTGLTTLKELWGKSSGDLNEQGFNRLDENVFVFTDKGNWKRATHTFKTKGKTIRVTFDTGDIVEGLPDHKIWIFNDKQQLEFKYLRDVQLGDTTLVQLINK